MQMAYENKLYEDFSFIDLGEVELGDNPLYEFDLVNNSVFNLEGIKLVTNMPKEAYKSIVPKTIVPYSRKGMRLQIFTDILFNSASPALWDDKKKKNVLAIRLDYVRTRKFTL